MNYNLYQNAEIVSIPELSQHYKVKLDEKYYKLYSKKSDGTIKNFYVLESYDVKILFDNGGNIIDNGSMRIENIKEEDLSKILNLNSYKNCYYTDDIISKFYYIEGDDNIYTKLRKGEFNTICFKIE